VRYGHQLRQAPWPRKGLERGPELLAGGAGQNMKLKANDLYTTKQIGDKMKPANRKNADQAHGGARKRRLKHELIERGEDCSRHAILINGAGNRVHGEIRRQN
jgi:hypothetical protein